MKRRGILALSLLLIAPIFAGAEEDTERGPFRPLENTLYWDSLALRSTVSLDLMAAGIKLPSGRGVAEEECAASFPRLVQEVLLNLPVDSSTTVRDLVDSGELHLADIIALSTGAKRESAALSPDLKTMNARYLIELRELFPHLVRHRHTTEPTRPLDAIPGRTYTGIIIYATGSLPLYGRHISKTAQACLFPKIWDSEMNLIYERNMVAPAVARERGVVQYCTEETLGQYRDLTGRTPLRLIATALYGERPTDPVIDSEDAIAILASEENRQLLKNGKVVIIISREALAACP